MKNIITAFNNPILNEKMKEEKEINILTKDIFYQEGIFEMLEKENNINYIIIDEKLEGEHTIEELIEKINSKNKKIKLIIILEKENEKIKELLYNKKIEKFYYKNNLEINNIIKFIKKNYKNKLENNQEKCIENNIENKLRNKTKENKKNNLERNIIKEEKNSKLKQIIYDKNKINNNLENQLENKIKNKIISILGTGGTGKSIVTVNIANSLKQRNNKILIIDFDILNNSLHTILGVNKYPNKIRKKLKNNTLINNKINIKDLVININKNIDLVSGINLVFDSRYKISSCKIKNILQELQENYNYIIIDNSSECFFDYTKNIIENSDISIFLIESNLLEIKKAINLLKIYNEKWNINKNKIKILINKYNKNSIDENIIKNIFYKFKIIGKLKLNEKYNLIINKNYLDNNIKKEYNKISKNIKEEKILLFNNK